MVGNYRDGLNSSSLTLSLAATVPPALQRRIKLRVVSDPLDIRRFKLTTECEGLVSSMFDPSPAPPDV